jgi:hypothetical protein
MAPLGINSLNFGNWYQSHTYSINYQTIYEKKDLKITLGKKIPRKFSNHVSNLFS